MSHFSLGVHVDNLFMSVHLCENQHGSRDQHYLFHWGMKDLEVGAGWQVMKWKTGSGVEETGTHFQTSGCPHTSIWSKCGMHYIKKFVASKAPRPWSKWMWHIKWNLLLMQTSGLRFLTNVILVFPWSLTAGLSRTPNTHAVTFRDAFTAQLPL